MELGAPARGLLERDPAVGFLFAVGCERFSGSCSEAFIELVSD